ncbi:MAG: T9SS type A sorting domain-containing protein [Flavobacteriales bacterium]|nr:T9SS type A sorting domain-containing protein [Flavobacteriales bacterium]
MIKLTTTLFSLLLSGIMLISSAQSPSQADRVLDADNMREGESVEYCIQHKKMMEMLKDPAKMKIWQAEQAQMNHILDSLKTNRSASRGTVYKIPIVFHVLHNGGPENISNAQIMDALEILNRDFRLQNTDANNVVATFQGMPTDVEIEFVLATKAPNGTCFSGITRTQSAATNDGDNGFTQISAIEQGNDVYNGTWAEKKYLNIFICADIGGAAGYTFNPFGSGNSTSGIWVLHNYVGSMGTSSVSTSRTLTHEVGHWLNLDHTWGGNNNPGNASSCNDDDNVDDTPRCIGLTSCNLNANTCSNDATDGYWTTDVVDNAENYMDYSYCSKMFTQGQVDRMRASLLSGSGGRSNIITTSNLNAVGANGNAPLCKAEFQADYTTICEGGTVNFEDMSYHNVTGWTWTFNGGIANSTTIQNPSVTYATAGTYTVSLVASDGSSTVNTTKTGYITVLPATGRSLNVVEGFESGSISSSEWFVENPDGSNGWAITSSAAATGTKSLKLNNTTNDAGDVDEFISSTIDLSNAGSVSLTFKYAFAKKTSTDADYMRVSVSNDCGETWSVRKNISSSILATAPNTTSSFTPSVSQWTDVNVTNITSTYWTSDFRFKISFYSGGGNNVYIDDINLSDASLGVYEVEQFGSVSLYPNPANDQVNVNLDLSNNASNVELVLTDLLGQQLEVIKKGDLTAGTYNYSLNTTNLSKGIYLVTLKVGNQITTKKLIIE